MKYIYTGFKKLTTLLILIFSLLSFTSFSQGFSTATQTRLQHVLDSIQNDATNPVIGGISAAINVDGLALWLGATGYASRNIDAENNLLPGGTAFETSTLSQIYSVTKSFTASLVLELAREGSLNLDDAVSNYLPMSLINPTLNSSVTIRQLLAHESGYSNYTGEINLQIAVAFQPTHVWTPFETLYFVQQINTPGAERRYSSTNYITLGAIIEVATGKTVAQHYRERFFTPLGYQSMYLGVREPNGTHGILADPHDNLSPFNPIFLFTGQPTFPDAITNIRRFPMTSIVSLAFSGGGIVSNVKELSMWGNDLFSGRATSASTLQTMMNSISSTPDDGGDYLGYGIWTNNKISTTDYFVGHDGNAPGYRSVMMYQPDRKMTIAVLTNYQGINPNAIAKVLYEALPNFITGNENRKEAKILLCWKGKEINVAREAAPELIKKGAYLGPCDQTTTNRLTNTTSVNVAQNENLSFTAFPNPFTNNTTIQVKTNETGIVNMQLYDVNGKLVKAVYNGLLEKGITKQVRINAEGLTPGLYICRLQTKTGISEYKLMLNK